MVVAFKKPDLFKKLVVSENQFEISEKGLFTKSFFETICNKQNLSESWLRETDFHKQP